MRNKLFLACTGYAILAASAPFFWAVSVPGAAFLTLGLVANHSKRRAAYFSVPVVTLLAMALLGALQLAMGVSVYRYRTEISIFAWIAYAVVAWLASQTDPKQVLPALACFAGAIATLAILVHSTSTFRIFWIFPVNYPHVFGPYVYRNHFAAFAELTLPVALYVACARREQRALFVLIAATLFAGVVLAQSRTGFVLCAAEVIAALVLAARRRLLPGRAAIVVAIALAAGAAAAGFTGLAERMQEQNPYYVRAEIAKSSYDMWRAHPVVGWGLGTWRTVYPSYARIDPGVLVNEAHNDWAQWACDGGIFAVLAMLTLAIRCVRRGMQTIWGLGVGVVFLHALIDYPFQEPSIVFLTMLLAGLMTARHLQRS